MPLSTGLSNAAKHAGLQGIDAALEVCGFTELVQLLSHKASFMGPTSVSDVDASQFRDDLRRTRDESTAPGALCGGMTSLADDESGVARVRALVYAARIELKKEEAAQVAHAGAAALTPAQPPAEDQCKPLPASEIDGYWDAGERVTGGYTWLPPKFRLSDTLMSKMIRANTAGELWIPPLDSSFGYKDASSTRTVTTLLRAGGQGSTTELSLQMVQGEQLHDRHDPITIAADYADIIEHRSAALVACYGSPEASLKYVASKRYPNIERHKLAATPHVMLMPRAIAMLKRALTSAARLGLSTSALLSMDKTVVDAIHERQSQYKEDGSLAIEYVCNQRSDLFRAAPSVTLSDITHDTAGSYRSRDAASSVGPSASLVDTPSQLGPHPGKASALERRLQSERDTARNELKRLRQSSDTSQVQSGRRNGSIRFGGDSRRSGGGDPRSNYICRDFNSQNGCDREQCKFKHICSKVDRHGRPCGDSRHSAVLHN